MPKRPKVRRVTETEILDPEPDTPELQYIDEDSEELKRMMAELGGEGIKIKVARVIKGGTEHCFTSDEAIDDLEDVIQSQCGGGKFIVRIFSGGMLRLSKTVNVANRAGFPGVSSGMAVPGAYGNPQDMMFRLMEAQMNALRDEIRSLRSSPQSTASELAQAVAALHQVNNGGSSPMDLLKMSMEIAKHMNGQGSEPDWKMEALSAAKEILPAMFKAGQAPTGANGAAMNPNPGLSQGALTEEQLKAGLADLKKQCLRGASPEFYIEALILFADREPYASLTQLILDPARKFESFVEIDPEIGTTAYRGFFESIYNGVRSYYQESDSVDGDTSGKGGNDGNRKPNGQAGKGSKPKPGISA